VQQGNVQNKRRGKLPSPRDGVKKVSGLTRLPRSRFAMTLLSLVMMVSIANRHCYPTCCISFQYPFCYFFRMFALEVWLTLTIDKRTPPAKRTPPGKRDKRTLSDKGTQFNKRTSSSFTGNGGYDENRYRLLHRYH
jgi:uncharacterized membrane protein YgcG